MKSSVLPYLYRTIQETYSARELLKQSKDALVFGWCELVPVRFNNLGLQALLAENLR